MKLRVGQASRPAQTQNSRGRGGTARWLVLSSLVLDRRGQSQVSQQAGESPFYEFSATC